MRLNNFDRLILIGLLLAAIVNIFSDYVSENYQQIQIILFPLVILSIVIWFLTMVGKVLLNKIMAGKYAVEVFVLNDKNELLVYYHPYHDKHIPPGGRVKDSEFPDETVKNRLQERVGLQPSDYTYHELFHPDLNPATKDIGKVERVPNPFIVQKEFRRQRGLKKFHYDYFYVLRLTNPKPTFLHSQYQPIRFVDKSTLEHMIASKKSFSDVLDAYERILNRISSQNSIST